MSSPLTARPGAGSSPWASVTGATLPPVVVDLGARSYAVHFVASAMRAMGEALGVRGGSDRAPRLAIVTDRSVWSLWGEAAFEALGGAGWRTTVVPVEPGEASKSVEVLAQVWDALLGARFERGDVVVAFGGGVVGDLAGFAAATLLRGVGLVQVPTTLLAMVDSSVGGKTGINRPAGKNLVGAFHQPVAVVVDTRYLRTLPAEEFRSGMAEVIKYGAILDAELLRTLERDREAILRRDPAVLDPIVRRCVELKAHVVSRDEREGGLRMILNFGHTIGHAIEAVTGYAGVRHGEAVAIGMAGAARIAERMGLVDAREMRPLVEVVGAFGLPTRLPSALPERALLAAMAQDKKATGGRQRFILPTGAGSVRVVEDVPQELVLETLRWLGAR